MCKILSVEGNVVTLDKMDAFDKTPVLDLKPVIGRDFLRQDFRVPGWAGGGRKK